MDYLSDPGRVCYDSRVGLVLGSHVCCSSIRWSGLLPSATVAPESGLGHPGISSGHSPPGMFALSPAPPSLQIQPILPSPSHPDISRFKISLVRNQVLRWVYINHALDILLGQKPFFLLPPSRLGIHLVCWIICNDGATPQINFTQICFRCLLKARSKPVNW